MRINFLRRKRRQSGVVMATVDLLIMVPLTVGLIFFLLNTGTSVFFKSKLSFVTQQAANFAITLPQNTDPTPKTKAVVVGLLQTMGLPAGANVGITPVDLGGKPGLSVEITDDFPIFGGAGSKLFPAKFTLSENATALYPIQQPKILFPIDNALGIPAIFAAVNQDSLITVGQIIPDGSFRLALHIAPPIQEVVVQPESGPAH